MNENTRVIDKISDPFGPYPFVVEVDFHEEDPQGNRDVFQTERIALDYDVFYTDNLNKVTNRIQEYVCKELYAEMKI